MSQLFGYSIDRKKKGQKAIGPSFVTKDTDDAAQPIVAGGYFGQYVDLGDAANKASDVDLIGCLLYTSPSPRDRTRSRMPSSA